MSTIRQERKNAAEAGNTGLFHMASSQASPGSEAASSSGSTSTIETSRFSTCFAYVRRTHFCAGFNFGLSWMPGPVHDE